MVVVCNQITSLPTGHCVMGRLAERMQLSFNDIRSECRAAEEEETVIHFLCQCPRI